MRHCIFLACLLVGLAACATKPVAPEKADEPVAGKQAPAGDSRYAQDRDSAPLKPIRAEDVKDASPRPDPLLAAGNRSPYIVDGVSYEVLDEYRSYREQGIASWYGTKFDGYETSNGEIYDVYEATAAHRTLPIPTYARVTNLDNGRSVIVRVNDRGPFHADRLIDLSYAAAVKLGYFEKGTAPVEVEVVDVKGVEDRRDSGDYRYLQLGAFGTESAARRLQRELRDLVPVPVEVSRTHTGSATFYRVRMGPAQSHDHLLALQQLLVDSGYGEGLPLP